MLVPGWGKSIKGIQENAFNKSWRSPQDARQFYNHFPRIRGSVHYGYWAIPTEKRPKQNKSKATSKFDSPSVQGNSHF